MRNYIIVLSALFVISSCGGGGGGGGGGDATPATPTPTVNLSAEPTSVLLGNTSTLTWSSTNASSCSASWTSSTASFGTEAVSINEPGNNSFSISCSGSGGSQSASTVVEGYRNTDGVVVDGYISGAEVFIDENDNWSADSNESSSTSDNDGNFTIKYANGNLVSIGGTDLDSQTLLDNLLITHKLTGHSDFKAVTPVTSIAAFMEDASLVNAALGIDSSIDVFTFDPVANKGDGGINDYLYEKGNQLTVLAYALQNITNNLNTTTETTQDYFKAITEEIEKEYTETSTKVDIETETFVTKVFDNVITAKSVTIDEAAKTNAAKALAGVMPVIEVKSDDNLTTAVIRFAIATLQTEIQTIANGSASAETVTSYTEDILNYIAEDQNIDANKITPNVTALADSGTTQEDTPLTIDVLANDSYITTSPLILSSTNGTYGESSITNNSIIYTPNADYNGSDTFTYTLTQGDKTATAQVSITIESVNDKPSIDIASIIQVQENQSSVTTISVSDPDDDDLTLTLGGTDEDSFNLSSENVLTFKEIPNFEIKNSYEILLTLTDGSESVDKSIRIDIIKGPTETNAPSFSNFSINPSTINVSNDSVEVEMRVTIMDDTGIEPCLSNNSCLLPIPTLRPQINNDYISYGSRWELVSGDAKNGIYESSATIETSAPNAVYRLYGGSWIDEFSNFVTISLTDVLNVTNNRETNPPEYSNFSITPSVIDITDDQVNVKMSINITDDTGIVGELPTPTLRPQINNDYISYGSQWELVSGDAKNGIYESSATIETSAPNAVYRLYGGPWKDAYDNFISIVISDVLTVNKNSNPIFTSSSTFVVDENQTSIGTVTATDVDGDNITFSVADSDFQITSDGVLTFLSAPDYETKSVYTLTIIASDGRGSTSQDITVSINNLNDNTPVITSSYSFIADENQTSIGTVTATDADGDDITFSVVGTELQITSGGVLSFVTAPDYETKYSYSGTVTATDGKNSTSQSIKITVRDVKDTNEAPTITSASSFIVNENQTSIGTVTAIDEDGDTIIFSITGTEILIDSSSGVLTFDSAPDYETKYVYKETVTVSDATDSSSQNITLTIININDNAPVITSSPSYIVEENVINIGTVSSTDADGDALTYSLNNDVDQLISVGVSSSSGLAYTIADENRKSLTLEAGKTYTFSHSSAHPLRFSTTNDGVHNGGNEYTTGVQKTSGVTKISVDSSTPSTLYYYCNIHSGMGASIATSSVTSTIIDIDEVSGELTFAVAPEFSGSPDPDFEKMPFYNANVSVTDGLSTATQAINVSLTNITAEGIVFTSGATYAANENQLQIGSVNAVSATGKTITYSASVGDEPIKIDSSSGLLSFTLTPDYETKSSYTITVSATDGTSTKSKNIIISINNLNDNVPIFTSASSLNVSENQLTVGTITASDADGDNLTFTTASPNFSITESGLLTFLYNPDYETRNTFLLLINVTDGENASSQNLTINLIDEENDTSSNYARYLEGPLSDPEHVTAKYHAKHCYYTHEVNGEEESRWLWDAGLTDEQKIETYTDIQSVQLTNGQIVTAECISDYEMGFGTFLDTSTADAANNKGIYGVSQYIRIWEELSLRPLPQAGIYGQWIQPHAMHPYFTWQSIEGGLFSDDKVGRSKYPKYMAGAQSHLYNGDSTQFGWGFYEKRVPCEYLGGIQIANKMLLPPNLISFDEDQNNHITDGGMFFGHGWIAMPLIGGKNRENWSNGGTDEGRDINSGKLTWTFFVDAENFSGPLTAYAPEFWYRRVNKFNAYEILNERWEENLSTDTTFLNKTKDYIAGRITESEFVNLAKEQSWYVDGVENYDTDLGGDYMVRAKDSLAFNPVPAVALGAERDPSIGLTEIDDEGNMYLKTFFPQIPDTNNIEPFLLSGRTYGVEHYNNFVKFFESSDPDTININFETSQFTTALVQNENEGFVGADTIKYDSEENDDNWWVRSEIKDASGNLVPNKYSFEAGVGVTTETNDNGSNVYWDWKNNSERMFSEYYKVADSDNPTNFVFERTTESEVPDKLKNYTHNNLTNVTSYMPHIKTSEDEELEQSIKNDMKEYFNADLSYMDYSCRACNDENGCDAKTYSTTLDDGTVVTYRWYRFKDQPTFLQLKNEFPEIYTDEYLNKLQTQIEYIHSNWINSKDFLSRPSSVNNNNLNLVEIDNALILTPPTGKEVGWVPIAISAEAPGKKWQREVNWWDGPKRSSWDGTGSEFYRFRSW